MTIATRPDILPYLQSVREDVERKVAALDRFRALQAIEQTIVDFPGLDDLTRSLSSVRDQVKAQLDETREFRALRAIERIMPELSEVLALVEDAQGSEPDYRHSGSASSPMDAATAAADASSDNSSQDVGDSSEVTSAWVMDESETQTRTDQTSAERVESVSDRAEETTAMQDRPAQSDAALSGPDAEVVPSLADSVAQLMAQTISPHGDAHAPPSPPPRDMSATAPSHAEQAA